MSMKIISSSNCKRDLILTTLVVSSFLTFLSPCPITVLPATRGSCGWIGVVGYSCSPSDCNVCIPEINITKNHSHRICPHVVYHRSAKEHKSALILNFLPTIFILKKNSTIKLAQHVPYRSRQSNILNSSPSHSLQGTCCCKHRKLRNL